MGLHVYVFMDGLRLNKIKLSTHTLKYKRKTLRFFTITNFLVQMQGLAFLYNYKFSSTDARPCVSAHFIKICNQRLNKKNGH